MTYEKIIELTNGLIENKKDAEWYLRLCIIAENNDQIKKEDGFCDPRCPFIDLSKDNCKLLNEKIIYTDGYFSLCDLSRKEYQLYRTYGEYKKKGDK